MAEFKARTQQEFDTITRRTAHRRKRQLLAVDARYDRRGKHVMITLNNGAVVGFPLSALPGLECATPDDLRHIEVEGGGYGLHVLSLDADISVPPYWRTNSARRSCGAVARANASKESGRLGGRRRKPEAA